MGNNNTLLDRYRGCLLGLAVGDALGAQVEFKSRGDFIPPTEMEDGGTHGLKAGEWTDDTSMALCLADSLVTVGHFDAHDQMHRYCKWYQEGYMSSNGSCFDIGYTTREALECYIVHNWSSTVDSYCGSTNAYSSGNGSIMRLAPIPMFYHGNLPDVDLFSRESSRTTHGSVECIQCCSILGQIINNILGGEQDKTKLLTNILMLEQDVSRIKEIINAEYLKKTSLTDSYDIKGSGYVVDSLEAALWSFGTTDSFEGAISTAIMLGDDTDTTAAVTGQIAGAYYGINGIPERWLSKLAKRDMIQTFADKLYEVK